MASERSRTFDAVAGLYDAVRPGYPQALVDAAVAGAGLSPRSRLLEIGVGTGKATVPFARQGCAILGLEPGANLAAVAARNLAAFPGVTIERATLEDWPVQPDAFDLVFSAQAFHWVAPEVRYVKAAQALRPGGHLALFWNTPSEAGDPLFEELHAVYRRVVPEMAERHAEQNMAARTRPFADEITRSGLFQDLSVQRFPWSERYETGRYLRLLDTYSDHRLLPPDTRRALFDGVAAVVDSHGGVLVKPYVAVLYLARRR